MVGLTEFDAFIKQSKSQQSKSELDEESLLPRYHEFDVMQWWKLNESKYPILSKKARDTLTLPVSTVDPESIFDTCQSKHCYSCRVKYNLKKTFQHSIANTEKTRINEFYEIEGVKH